MEYTHPIDRLMLRIRPALILGAYASFPIFMVSYGFAMHWLVTTAPLWASVPSVIAHLIVLLGIGSLIDIRSESRRWSEDGQSPLPPRS